MHATIAELNGHSGVGEQPLPHDDDPRTGLATRSGVAMDRLVGRPHLFARMRELRDGFMIHPIAVLTLQPDGRITGYGHRNEGSWIPYEQGPVEPERAFAFISAVNKWIPSSTWVHSLGDMPIGHFCDEPEAAEAVQKLCLIPHETGEDASGIVYLVASCAAFYERTVPALLEQLDAEGISADRIRIVVNGSPRNEDRVIDGVEHAFSTHNAWEWSALYEAPLRWRFDYAFLMHDTNLIFPGFRRSVEGFNRHLRWDHLPASPLARCLIGHYSRDFLMRLNPWLRSKDGLSKRDGVIAEAAGELLLRARTALVLGDPEASGGARAAEWRETLDMYDTGSPRVRRVFPAIKLHKLIHAYGAAPESL